jgi:hypothetical protein
MSRIKATGFYCRNCAGRMFYGAQYYAFQKNYVDLTCVKCSTSVDVEVRKLNKILGTLGFKKLEERYELADQNSHK